MGNICDKDFKEENIINNDIILSICIDLTVRICTKRNKEQVRERLLDIFTVSRLTDCIMLKDALWISDALNLLIFSTLKEHSSKYLYGYEVEVRKVFGRMTKNKEYHLNYQNFRLLFIHCVLLQIHETTDCSG